VVNRTSLVKPFADVNSASLKPWSRSQSDAVRLAPDRALGTGSAGEGRLLDDPRVADPRQLADQLLETIADKFDLAVIDLSRDIQFAPGYAPAETTSQ
jgi:hypothetical protein